MTEPRAPDHRGRRPEPLDVIRTFLLVAQAVLSLLRFLTGN